MISLTIDGKEVTIEKGKTILDAARKADVYIPTLCHDSRVTPYGACRMCVVEDKNRGKWLIPSCFTPAREGMDIVTETPEIVAARRTQLQLILVNHPLDCPVCDKAGECSLQELVLRYNITDTQYHLPEKRKDIDRVSPLIERNMNRCILCGLCVRICGELQGTHEIDFIGRGIETLIGTDGQRPLNCDFCGQCISVCPVGALTDTLFKDVTRVWKLEKHETVCSHCGLGCSIDLNTEHNKIRRVTAPVSDEGDISNLCVRGRFGWSAYESSNRLSSPRVRINNMQETVQWHEAISRAAENIDRIRVAYGGDAFAFISSDVWTTEEAYAYQMFCRSVIGSNNMGSTEAEGYRQIVTILNDHSGEEWKQGTLKDFEKAEVILVIGGGAVERHPVLKPMINTFLKKDGRELVVISSWRDYFLERATLPIEIKPESQEIFLSELRESLSGNIECRQSDVSEFGVDCSELARLVSLLDGKKEILLLVAPYLFGDNEQLGQLAAYLSDRVRAILPLGAQCNSRGAMFHAGFSSILQPGGMPVEKSKRGLNHTDEIFKAIENRTIRALYLLGDDPLENSPDPERIKDLLKKLDLLIYQSPYEGASASLADIVFPSATIPEKSGSVVSVFGNQENINPVIAMPDGVKTDLRILRELADAMGYDGKDFAIDTVRRRLLEQVRTVRDEAIFEHHDLPGERAWKKEEDVMTKSPDFPYIMIPVPSLFGDGVVSRNSPQLNELRNGLKVLMSPGDFEEHSFEKNELVEIVSPFGSTHGRIECSASVQRGTVLASNLPGSPRGLRLLKKQHRVIPVNIVRIKENGQ